MTTAYVRFAVLDWAGLLTGTFAEIATATALAPELTCVLSHLLPPVHYEEASSDSE